MVLNIVIEVRQNHRKADGKILVEFDPHRMCGVAGTGKSSAAEAAAKVIAA